MGLIYDQCRTWKLVANVKASQHVLLNAVRELLSIQMSKIDKACQEVF